MIVGVCHIAFLLHDNRSLKGKRSVLKKVLAGVKNHFNVSASEVGSHDLWQRAEIGITLAGTDNAVVNSTLDKILDYIEDTQHIEVIEQEIELINCTLLGK